jgi:hypothetical protein
VRAPQVARAGSPRPKRLTSNPRSCGNRTTFRDGAGLSDSHRQTRVARRRRPSAADADELEVALCYELGRDAGAHSAVTKVLADRLTREVGRVGERRLAPRGLADWCRFPPAPHRSVHAVVPHTAHRRSSPSAFGSLTPRPVRPGRSDGSVQADQSVAVGPGVERVSAVAPRLLMAGCDPQL